MPAVLPFPSPTARRPVTCPSRPPPSRGSAQPGLGVPAAGARAPPCCSGPRSPSAWPVSPRGGWGRGGRGCAQVPGAPGAPPGLHPPSWAPCGDPGPARALCMAAGGGVTRGAVGGAVAGSGRATRGTTGSPTAHPAPGLCRPRLRPPHPVHTPFPASLALDGDADRPESCPWERPGAPACPCKESWEETRAVELNRNLRLIPMSTSPCPPFPKHFLNAKTKTHINFRVDEIILLLSQHRSHRVANSARGGVVARVYSVRVCTVCICALCVHRVCAPCVHGCTVRVHLMETPC